MSLFEGLQSVDNIHPIVVHFPIGLLITSTCLFIVGRYKKELFYVAKYNLIIGSLCAIGAVVTGAIASNSLPHSYEIHQAMGVHRDLMVITTLLSLILAVYVYMQDDIFKIKRFPFFIFGLVLMTVVLAVGADYGGKMVFKYGAGTELFTKLNPDAGGSHNHNHHHDNKEIDINPKTISRDKKHSPVIINDTEVNEKHHEHNDHDH